jgi:prepilin-type N-terminal cleavage/methylation domain-containing protein
MTSVRAPGRSVSGTTRREPTSPTPIGRRGSPKGCASAGFGLRSTASSRKERFGRAFVRKAMRHIPTFISKTSKVRSTRSRCILFSVGRRSSPAGPGRGERGFTLLELLVALAILGSTFTVLLSAHTSAARVEAEARRVLTATALTRDVLSRTEVEGLPVFEKDSGDFGEDFPGYRWEREVSDVPLLPLQDLKQVTIRILWAEGQRTRSSELVFLHLNRT